MHKYSHAAMLPCCHAAMLPCCHAIVPIIFDLSRAVSRKCAKLSPLSENRALKINDNEPKRFQKALLDFLILLKYHIVIYIAIVCKGKFAAREYHPVRLTRQEIYT